MTPGLKPEFVALLLVGLVAVAGISASYLAQDTQDLTGASSLSKLLKKMKQKLPPPPPPPPKPAGPACVQLGGIQCFQTTRPGTCAPFWTDLGPTSDCTLRCCGPPRPGQIPSSSPPPTPTASPTPPPQAAPQPTPTIPITPPPAPTPPSCEAVTGGQGKCMSRYCDTGPNSLDKIDSRGYCPGSNEVCCIKNYLASKPDGQLTCEQVRAKYGASNSWCIQNLPCQGTLGRLPRYIGRTTDCTICCIET